MTNSPETRRVKLAIVGKVPSPYWTAFTLRVARELDVDLQSIYLLPTNNQNFSHDLPPETRPVVFHDIAIRSRHRSLAWQLERWRHGKRFCQHLHRWKPDAALFVGYTDPAGLRAMRWCARHDVRTFLFGDSNIRCDFATGRKARLKQRILKHLFKRVDAFFPCGSLGRAYFEKYGARPDRVFYLPLEPNFDAIDSVTPADVQAVSREFNLDPGRKRINFTGRLVDLKRVDTLLDAFARIAGERPEWDLLIVGSGPKEEDWKARVSEHLKHRVIWAGFQRGEQRLAALYKASHVYAITSEYEAWSVSTVEAAACGLAILASDVVGAAAELVHEGKSGRTFPPGDTDALASALLDITHNAADYGVEARRLLERWRENADPIDGLQAALQTLGLHAPRKQPARNTRPPTAPALLQR